MSQFSSNTAEFLAYLEFLSQGDPIDGIQGLTEVPKTLNQLIENGSLDACQKAVRILGDTLGKQRDWQQSFQQSGVLAFVLERLDSLRTPVNLSKQYLRVIGNCVADNDETREDVIIYLEKIITCLQKDELRVTALAVMFNLCNDFELAQAQCANLRADKTIAECLAADKIDEDAIEYAATLMTWTTGKLNPDQIANSTSLSTFSNVLGVSLRTDDDIYYDFISICAHYLENPQFQKEATSADILNKILDMVLDFESKLTFEEMKAVFKALGSRKNSQEIPLKEQNATLLVQLIHSLSTLSASDTFVKQFDVRSPFVGRLISKLSSNDATPSTVLACVILGNLATSDFVSLNFVQSNIHLVLLQMLSAHKYPALLYAAAGFMRHLAFPLANRQVLGETGLMEICCRLLSNTDPFSQGEAAAILGKLVTSNLQNVRKVVYCSIPNGIGSFQVPGIDVPEKPTLLYYIITQAFAPSAPLPSTSMKNAGIEIGRLEIAMLRTLVHSSAELDNPSLRVYLDLGLMAQTEEGAAAVVKEIEAEDGLLEAIGEFAISQNSETGKQVDFEIRRDPQNAIVLLHGLETNGINLMDASLKTKVDSLRAKLERIVLG